MDQRLVLVPRNPWWIHGTNGIYLHWWLTFFGIKINIPVWMNHGIFVICLEILKMWNMENSGLVGKDVSVFVGFRTEHLLDMQWKTLFEGSEKSQPRSPEIGVFRIRESQNKNCRRSQVYTVYTHTHTPEVEHSPWNMVVGRLLSYWEGNFSGANC